MKGWFGLLFGEGIGIEAGVEDILAIHAGDRGVGGEISDEAGLRVRVSEDSDGESGDFADQVEAAEDSGFGATAFTGDLGDTEEIGAIEAEDFPNGRGRPAAAGVEFFKESEGGEDDLGGDIDFA